MASERPIPARDVGRLPTAPFELQRALQLADFANPDSMRTLQSELAAFAQRLRQASAAPTIIGRMIRALVDDSLPTRVVAIRTSEDRTKLLALAAEWSAAPVV